MAAHRGTFRAACRTDDAAGNAVQPACESSRRLDADRAGVLVIQLPAAAWPTARDLCGADVELPVALFDRRVRRRRLAGRMHSRRDYRYAGGVDVQGAH